MVLPEFLLSPSSVPFLLSAVEDMAVIAGVGVIKPPDVDVLTEHGFSGAVAGNNSAIAFDKNSKYIISKKNASPFERLDVEGSGYKKVNLLGNDDKEMRIAIAICMDYIMAGAQLNGDVFDVDIIAVPAWTDITQDFLGVAPRNAVLAFANASLAGASSTIIAPGLNGGIFAKNNVLRPLNHKGEDAVLILEYEGPLERPTRAKSLDNHLFARAAICSAGSGIDQEDVGIIEEMQAWEYNGYYNEQYNSRLLEMTNSCRHSILADAVKELSNVLQGNPVSKTDFVALCRHIVLRGEKTLIELEYEKLIKVQQCLQEVIQTSDINSSLIGSLLGKVCTKRKILAPDVGLEGRTAGDQFIPTSSSLKSELGEKMVTIVAVRLPSFKEEKVLETFPAQLALLHSLIATKDDRLILQYSVQTENNDTSEFMGFFNVHLLGRDLDEAEIEEYREGLGQLLAVTLSSAFNLDLAPDPQGTSNEKSIYLHLPYSNVNGKAQPAISEDWSLIVDFLRTQKQKVSLVLGVTPIESRGTIQNMAPNCSSDIEDVFMADIGMFARTMRDSQASSVGFISEHDRKAAGYLWRVAVAQQEYPFELFLTIKIVGESVDNQLAQLIGTLIFGGAPFELAMNKEVGTRLSCEDALRVFHLPYGYIQGRGLPNGKTTNIGYNGISKIPSSGTVLGTVRLPGPRVDSKVPYYLSDEVRLRHQYVIGSTGSGKTNLLKNMVLQDLEAGRSVIVLDPHGSLAEYCASHAGNFGYEAAFLDFGSSDGFIPNVDPFTLDYVETPGYIDGVISEVIEILRSQTFAQFTGPRFVSLMSLIFHSLHYSKKNTLDLMTAYNVIESQQRRKALAEEFIGSDYGEEWGSVLFRNESRDLEEIFNWAAAKLSEFSHDARLRQVVGQGSSNVSLKQFIASLPAQKKCLAIRLPEWELGNFGTSFLSRLLLSRIRKCYFNKESSDNEIITTLYVDEFQKFVSSDFETFLTESRKFGVALTLANQSLSQLSQYDEYENATFPRMERVLLGNVGTKVVFNIGANDRARLSDELDISMQALADIAPFEAIASVTAASVRTDPFSVQFQDSRRSTGTKASINTCIQNACDSNPNRTRVNTLPEEVLSLSAPSDSVERSSSELLSDWMAKKKSLSEKNKDDLSKGEVNRDIDDEKGENTNSE